MAAFDRDRGEEAGLVEALTAIGKWLKWGAVAGFGIMAAVLLLATVVAIVHS